MSNLKGRKVKSLNDIPAVLKYMVASEDLANSGNQGKPDAFLSHGMLQKLEDPGENDFSDSRGNSDPEEKSTEISKDGGKIGSKNEVVTEVKYFFKTLPENREEQELEGNPGKKLRKRKRILFAIDVLLALIFIAPMTVGFWRGTWTLMDFHADLFPGVFTFFLGIMVHTSFAILKNSLHLRVVNAFRKKQSWPKKILWKSVQILYTYVFGVACNMQWRGGWIIFDQFLLHRTWVPAAATIMAVILLTIFRSVRNLISIPLIIAVDELSYVFRFPTRYKSNTRDWSLYLLDCAFSVGVVGTLVVFVWRGVWILFDLYLFPEDREYSAIGSLAIGYVIVTVTFSLQPFMRYVCARLQGLARLIAADGFLLLSFLGTVNVWRGIWNVLDLYLVPDNPELSCWITHIGCFVFLVLLNCSNSVLVRGVYIDAEEDDGKCVVFPCHYLRLFFKVEREKKEARRRNLLVASKDFRPRPDGNTKDTENGALLSNNTGSTILPTSPESLV